MVNARALNRKITIKRKESGQDTWGQPIIAWVTVYSPFAEVKAPTGLAVAAERMVGGLEISTAAYSFRVRHREGINPGMRVEQTHDGVTAIYDIKQVIDDVAGREYLFLVCETGGNEG